MPRPLSNEDRAVIRRWLVNSDSDHLNIADLADSTIEGILLEHRLSLIEAAAGSSEVGFSDVTLARWLEDDETPVAPEPVLTRTSTNRIEQPVIQSNSLDYYEYLEPPREAPTVNKRYCHVCSIEIPPGAEATYPTGTRREPHCRAHKYGTYCRACGTQSVEPNHIRAQGCVTCTGTKQCPRCKQRAPAAEVILNGRCMPCYRGSPTCNSCGERRPLVNFLCNSCRVYNDGFAGYILPYTTNVLNLPFSNNDELSLNPTGLMLGVELELAIPKRKCSLELCSKIVEQCDALLKDKGVMKFDRSIQRVRNESYDPEYDSEAEQYRDSMWRGFEIVTRPMGIKSHTALWREFINNKPPDLRGWSPGTCGMHVHINRAHFSQLEIGKFIVFVNAPNNREFIRHMARRDSQQFAQLYPKSLLDGWRGREVNRNGHYDAVNAQPAHAKTLELRIFRSSLHPETVLSNLQFTHSLSQFVKSVGHSDLTVENYLAWLDKEYHPTQFRELRNHINNFGKKRYNENRINKLA